MAGRSMPVTQVIAATARTSSTEVRGRRPRVVVGSESGSILGNVSGAAYDGEMGVPGELWIDVAQATPHEHAVTRGADDASVDAGGAEAGTGFSNLGGHRRRTGARSGTALVLPTARRET